MIERDLHLFAPAGSLERRLEAAAALVHVLVARPADGAAGAGDAAAAAVLEALALPIAVLDATSRAPRLANRAWRVLHGAGDGATLRAHAGEVIRTGATLHLAELALAAAPADRPAYCATTLRPIHGGGGATGAIVVCALLTDEVIARELGVGAGALIWGGPAAGDPDYFNGAWCAYTAGATGSPILRWEDAIHADDLPRCVQAFGAAAGGGAVELEARVRRADGGYRRHQIRFSRAAAAPRWSGVATDIEDARAEAERAEALAAERAASADVEQAHRLKDRFLAVVSHELRRPLTTMLLWENVLRDEAAGPALRAQALDAIHQSTLSQARLVDDLLDLARASSGNLYVDLRPLDLERVVREALAASAPAACARGIALDRRGAPVAGEVLGDDERLRQVLDNLLANAVKFTDPGGRVTIGVAREDETIAIEIEDSGCGIAPEALARLFAPFSRFEATWTRSNGGLGLGLAIARQIVELHHGELTAASAGPGRGATFTVRLPVADAPAATVPAGSAAHPPTLEGIRVLIVDDDQRVRDTLALLLGRVGAVVDTAESAPAARAQIALHVPETILCDIAMPGEDGNALLRGLRASGLNIPAISLTAHAMESDVECAFAAGFDRHVAKPIDFERLVESIGELVAGRRGGGAQVIASDERSSS